jgi:hypothetical protein
MISIINIKIDEVSRGLAATPLATMRTAGSQAARAASRSERGLERTRAERTAIENSLLRAVGSSARI